MSTTEGSLLLDTNAAIQLLEEASQILPAIARADRICLPLTALGELEFGARNSARQARNLAALEELLQELDLLAPDRATAVIYGDLRVSLRRKGRPIPQNDIWIAAIALQHGLPLLTRDAHFSVVDHLAVLGW